MGGIVSKQAPLVVDVGLVLGNSPSDELRGESKFSMRLINNVPDVLSLLKKNAEEVESFGKAIKKTSEYYRTMNKATLTSVEAFTTNTNLHKNPPEDVNVVHKLCIGMTTLTKDPFTPCSALDDLYQKVGVLVQTIKDLTKAGKSEFKILEAQKTSSLKELDKLRKRCAERSKKLQEIKSAPLTSIAEKTKIDFEVKNLETYIAEDKQVIKTQEELIQKVDRSVYNILTHFEVMERKRVKQLQTLSHSYFQIRKAMAQYLAEQMREVLSKVSLCQPESELSHFISNCAVKPNG